MLLNASRIALLGIALLGGYAFHVFSETNGLFPMAGAAQKRGKFPDGPIYQPVITGVEAVDATLNLLLQFFWPVVDGKHIDAALAAALLGAQGTAAFVLTTIEGLRYGNKGRIISFTTLVGVLIQLFGFGCIGPAYLFVHLLTVPPRAAATAKSISVPESYLRALPTSQVLGFIIPSVLMAVPAPDVLTTSQKITLILFWQLFPVWSAIILEVLGRSGSSSKPGAASHLRTLEALRGVYRFALWISVGGHILIAALSLGAYFRPDVVGEAYAGYLQPAYFYIPQNPFLRETKISSIAEGAFWFLQWDTVNTTIAYLIWGICVKYSTLTIASPTTVLWDIVVRPVLLGPASAALLLVWERDELILKGDDNAISRKGQ